MPSTISAYYTYSVCIKYELCYGFGFPQNINQDRFSLVGWSDGGITAMIMAAMIPEKIRKLVVFGANAYVSPGELEVYEQLRDVNKWSQMMRKPFEEVYGEEYFRDQFSQWVDAFSKYAKNPDGTWILPAAFCSIYFAFELEAFFYP